MKKYNGSQKTPASGRGGRHIVKGQTPGRPNGLTRQEGYATSAAGAREGGGSRGGAVARRGTSACGAPGLRRF